MDITGRYKRTDEPVINGHLIKKRYDINSYDVDLNNVCTGIKTRPIVNIGISESTTVT